MTFVRVALYPDTRARLFSIKKRGVSVDRLVNELIDMYQNQNTKQRFSLRDGK